MELAEKIVPNPDGSIELEAQNSKIFNDIHVKKEAVIDGQLKHLVEIYTPDKPSKDAVYFFSLLPHFILNTPTGESIKRIADRRVFKSTKSKDS